ncbi:DUF2970 domain-containing protein [Neptuniibacter sp. CAU 1671]|uniref:DUF2970 domain-containing protein n=1 Tax=Neptuniibacter sp. CAU 1671 TaxID=3032593 RepID=UPI0023DC799A|nr:DUF2970 domain-containing protein [Neptuniibacter sp. CAU 1671]MDF2182356.1 DUF2970 domain-containing protein [Neptuniibacter sp. CAU 1671]
MLRRFKTNNFWQVFTSTLAALFGVQSEKNRSRDFTSGKFLPYLVSGVVVALLFVLCVMVLVRVALYLAGA